MARWKCKATDLGKAKLLLEINKAWWKGEDQRNKNVNYVGLERDTEQSILTVSTPPLGYPM